MFRISTAASIAVLACGLLLAAGANGQTPPVKPAPAASPGSPPTAAETCSLADNALDERIAACTRTINSGTASQRELSLAFAHRGSAYHDKGNAARAVADYDEAVRLDPSDTVALVLRGIAFYGSGVIDRALADFNAALEIDPGDTAALTDRGLVYESRKDIARARADYNAALMRSARDKGGAAAREIAGQRLAALAVPTLLPPPPAVTISPAPPADIKPLIRQSGGAQGVAALMPPEPGAPNGTPAPAAATPNVLAIPRLPMQRLGVVAPILGPPETLAPDAKNGLVDVRAAALPVPPTPAHIPALGLARGAAGSVAAARPALVAPAPGPAAAAAAAASAATVALAQVAAPPPAANRPASRRIALVVGNSTYLTLHYIPSPLNDAADMASALKQLGFAVTLGLDLRRADMDDMLTRFAAEARTAETVLVYYSGHGLAHLGESYLVPVDGRVKDEADLHRLVRLKDVIDAIAGGSAHRIVILDASRDNEVGQHVAANLPGERAGDFGRGLGKITDAAGTLVVSAAQPNEVAADGKGRNSPFTQALLKHMQQTPTLAVKALMNAVRDEVMRTSAGAQRPDIADGATTDFALKTGK